MPDATIVYGTVASGTYHASERCAPEGHDQWFDVFAREAGLEPCGVCGPFEDEYACEDCDRSYKYEGRLFRHRVEEHTDETLDQPDGDDRYAELDQKARGGGDVR